MRLAIRRLGGMHTPSDVAAEWVLRREKGEFSDREQQRFEDWLAEDPGHVAAYEDAIWALDATARHAAAPELMAMRKAALAARGERSRTGWRLGGGGLAVAASFGALWFMTIDPSPRPAVPSGDASAVRAEDPRTATYRTAIGERLAVTLPDGSVVTLDTDSELRVAYSNKARGLRLLRGQALFEVAPGRPLPFLVHAAGQRIAAVGTVFNVRLDGDRVKVALVEGAVRVGPGRAQSGPARTGAADEPSPEIVMRAGEVLELGLARPMVVRQADVTQVASWRGGELVFNDVRLADAVAEINRYTTRPIVIADRDVGAHRVSGVFRSSDPERFAQAMGEVFPVEVDHGPDGTTVLRARD